MSRDELSDDVSTRVKLSHLREFVPRGSVTEVTSRDDVTTAREDMWSTDNSTTTW